jgi:hypothetical protein
MSVEKMQRGKGSFVEWKERIAVREDKQLS